MYLGRENKKTDRKRTGRGRTLPSKDISNKNGKKKEKTKLNYIINQSFEQHIFPESFKTVPVVPIYKKEDTVKISNYRPITLLSIFSKIFEKSMYNRIYSFHCKHKSISSY